ncbi:TRAP transporter substrate-binding protein [Sulfitobacter pseudonitzschiae]|uniref:TRAP transporter substrate-binding protein n=1 Tax=Pseudosulfitobacter pseudonitzschiae TaxID=1402135 RepID=A0A9Q2NRU8_9RHOB|nr:TRAP transporter substrate-binding protein [Pseudosulfitobacter pseudonitzschiae]MBM2293948.1 TRAP transporter substrate-binding protein [Pseudosulfitobacter pseudonitzschiae]MBM2298905.1 TRAP transporter substrate-binding protein [Pseudosulfitobacter pseudonitzschiae]MBM2303819.1 TRAP transporter substrate-binding protein [Pseudosulfitobacter pseudonitzschiae]MBM2313562.1 TRAP transporter substrate-binding protein [Pseudosulfitobacter pseudonitzschiae]MBM2318516.1 TRAP transporter substrat
MKKRTLLIGAAAAVAMLPGLAFAQEVTLRLHQFLPPVATVPAKILKPWGEEVTAASDGRIVIQHFDAMALGGRPPELLDQARDGVVDLAMTVVGYTPGRYPRTEVFELPFMMKDPIGTSRAFWEMVESDFQESEYQDVKVLGAWVHGPGVIHTKDPVTKLEDMKGKTLRGPTRVINDMLSELGATPVGMPLPAIPEALSKGVVNGTVIPWEVTPSIRLAELVSNHAEFSGDEALYTATIVLVMNKAKYDALPDDLKAILDEKSGAALSTFAAEVMYEYDKPGRDIAVANGNTIVQLDEAEVARWKDAAQPVVARWVADMDSKGIDGQALIDQAKGLIDKYSN